METWLVGCSVYAVQVSWKKKAKGDLKLTIQYFRGSGQMDSIICQPYRYSLKPIAFWLLVISIYFN